MPKVIVSKFDECPSQWVVFAIDFKEIIHNQHDLTGTQRMMYLLQHLGGKAKQSICSFSKDWSGYVRGLK